MGMISRASTAGGIPLYSLTVGQSPYKHDVVLYL